MATLAELETRLEAVESAALSTRKINQLTLTQTQDLGSTLSGGVFRMDGGGFVMSNLADGVALQDVATVNQVTLPPANTVFVYTEADLPPVLPVVIGGLGTFDFHIVTTTTQFVFMADVTLVAGISVNAGVKCIVTAANRDSGQILPNLPLANAPFFHAVAARELTVENVIIDSVAGGSTQSLLWTSGTAGVFTFRNVIVNNFPSIGNMSQGAFSILNIINSDFGDLTTNGLVIIAPNDIRILNSRFDYSGAVDVITFLGTSTVSAQILGNNSTNGSSFFLRIADSLDPASRIQVSSNFVTAEQLINDGAGFFTQADKQLIARDNIYQADSRVSARLFVKDNASVNQVIAAINTPVEIEGFTFTVDGAPQRFEVTTNIPGSPLLLTYKGNKARVAIIFEGSTDGTAQEQIAIGIFKNGTAVSSTFVAREQPATSAQPAFQVTNLGMELEFDDTLTFGIENQSSSDDIFLTNPVIFIGSGSPSF